MSKLRNLTTAFALLLALDLAAARDDWAVSYRFEAQGDYSRAIQALNPILRDEPEDEFVRLRVAWLRYLNRDYNASIRDYRRALTTNPKSIDAQLGVTLPLLAQSRWREASEAAQAVLAVAPWNYHAHLRLMVAEEGQGHWDALAKHAAALVARYPADATAWVYLARAEARRGNSDAALAAYQAVLARIPDHVEAQAFMAGHAA